MTKISKPRLTKLKMSDMWCCEGGYITYASTPEKAYNDWLAKERAEPYHIYSERTIKECLERIEKRKKENPEVFEKKYYSAWDTETETGIGIKYIYPITMSNTTVDKKKPWWRFWR